MADIFHHPGAPIPMPAVARILSRYDRQSLEGFIAIAIDLADAMDGDPEIELNGDEADAAWPEICGKGCSRPLAAPIEDAEDDDAPEDDDPAGGNVTDEPHDGDEGI